MNRDETINSLDPEIVELLDKVFERDSEELYEAAARIRELQDVPTETFKALLKRCPPRMALGLLRQDGFLSKREQAALLAGEPVLLWTRVSTESLRHVSEETLNGLAANCKVKLIFEPDEPENHEDEGARQRQCSLLTTESEEGIC